MKQTFSRSWIASKQPRKQRKFRHEAPLHIRHKFLAAHLSPALRESYGRRSMPLRKGDEIKVMRGKNRGHKGEVDRVDLKKAKIYMDSVKIKKSDGSEVHIPFSPSNILITKLNLDDARRKGIIRRIKPIADEPKEKKGKQKESKEEKKVDKPETKEKPQEERKPETKKETPKEEPKKEEKKHIKEENKKPKEGSKEK